MNDVKARLESIVQSQAKRLRDLGKATAALTAAGAAAAAQGRRLFESAVAQLKQVELSPFAWSLVTAGCAGAITAFSVALPLHFLDGASADIARLDKDIAAMSRQLDSFERTNNQAVAASHTAMTTLGERIAAAESAINAINKSTTALKNSVPQQAASGQPAPRTLSPGETAAELPELGRLEKRVAALEEKAKMQGTLVAETGAALPADMDHGPSAFPPFETANFMPMLIWLVLSFGLLYFLMSKIALPRVENILRTRANKITKDLSEANDFRTQSEQAAARHDKTIADARAKALALAQETHAKLNAETEAKRVALESELNAKLASAEGQILEMKAKAMSNVEGIANETAAAIVEHITGKPADPRAIKAAVATA